uniref:Snake toxin/toxin-like domain-containing protein n=1 Tax=Lynx canadensis TaxID=61383 RepID=A0A667IVD7_LYNCA
ARRQAHSPATRQDEGAHGRPPGPAAVPAARQRAGAGRGGGGRRRGLGLDGYDDDDEEEEGGGSVTAGGRGRAVLQCYSCQALHRGGSCDRIQNCVHSHSFCKAIVSHGNTGSGPLTTYSAWCADACQPFAKTVEGT